MEVKPGYKQTEVGVIPEDWDVLRLGDNSITYTGGTPLSSNQKYYGPDYYWITSSDLNKFHIHSVNGMISQEGLENSSAKMVKKGTLLIALYGATAGVTAITHINATINQAVLAIIPNHFDTTYLFNYFQFRKNWILGTFVQGGQPNLSGEIIRSLFIPHPSLPEQTSIATALSDMDALISGLDRLIEKKRAIKQAAMQELLTGKRRLPGFDSGKGYKQTEMGEIPEDWEVKQLGQIGNFKNGINKAIEEFGFGYPFVNLMNVFGVPSIEKNAHLDLLNSSMSERDMYSLQEGDVLFIRSSVKPEGVGLTTVVTTNLPDTVYSGFLIRFRENDFFNIEYKKYCFNENNFRKQVLANSTVSANTNINQNTLKSLYIAYPLKIKEQTAIATILSDMDAEISALESRRAKTISLKQGMMQELLTGRIRLV